MDASKATTCRALALALAAALPLAACAPTPGAVDEGRLSNAVVVRNFMRIAFGVEHTFGSNERISKWTEPELRVFLDTDLTGPHRRRVEAAIAKHLVRLEELTGLRLVFPGARSAEYAHLLVFVLPRADLLRQLGEIGAQTDGISCFGSAYRNPADAAGGPIRAALVAIPGDEPWEEVEACLVEEITQSLGLFRDDRHVHPSIFNDDDEYKELTWQDALLVRVLYDRRITPGMTPAEAEPLVRAIVDELRPQAKTPIIAPPNSRQ